MTVVLWERRRPPAIENEIAWFWQCPARLAPMRSGGRDGQDHTVTVPQDGWLLASTLPRTTVLLKKGFPSKDALCQCTYRCTVDYSGVKVQQDCAPGMRLQELYTET